MKAIILAGGKGTRLAPYTTILPKPLMPVGEMAILEIILRQMRFFGFADVTLACGYLTDLIRAYLSSSPIANDLNVGLFTENTPLGTAGALRSIEPDETFLAMNGDVLTTLDYGELFEDHCRNEAAMTIATFDKEYALSLGVVHTTADGSVIGYEEKPKLTFPVSAGIYVYEPRVLQYIDLDQYMDVPTLVRRLIDAGENVRAYSMDAFWLDIGNRDDFEKAAVALETHRDELHLDGVYASPASNLRWPK